MRKLAGRRLDTAGRRRRRFRPDVPAGACPVFVACSVAGARVKRGDAPSPASNAARVANRVVDAQHLRFLRDVVVAVARVRVIAQPLRAARPALLLDRLEHVGHVARVVAGARHDVRPLEVGLTLELAAEAHERAEAELRALREIT